ncbi:aldehyde dehydrogenase family protein [Rubrivirga sp. S365]|uniref:Aldehyde dehydrogenase family protein n=1 Tax=Rubrivirga litoralis TaxID=3075598 RepID=A0ABU3BTP4_9BACT|nr:MULTISPECIES: aldehyde dehydrogenase family protein [unclassified Rubrivirga]MDT0632657.1 aldehyde dehydrogenase family protein [Rubrivirga sp. F394]MDT7857166.1 aldehyde dehydrogenase family protein [Rubrivirga sp. S365]
MSSSDTHARHWIGGEWVDSETHTDSIDPATYDVIGTYADGGEAEAQACTAAAKRAFTETDWSTNRQLRAQALNEMADRFEAATDELVEILSLENGKVKDEARFEVTMAPSKLRFYAALALAEGGRAVQVAAGKYTTVYREPMGVAGVIAPWNSPIILFIRSLAPALAAGTTVAGKLPGQTAQTNAAMYRVFASVESLPAGVLNVFHESGPDGSKALVASPDVPTISFTGSTATGAAILEAGAPMIKRFGLELGGKTPHVVAADADLDGALPVIVKSLTTFAGQFCMTGSRLLVERPVYDEVRDRLGEMLAAVKAGPAADPESDMGPLIDRPNVDRVDEIVEKAIAEGATVVTRGGPITEGPLSKGAFYRPTLLEVADPKMDIVQEETFGPVLTMQAYDSEDEAIALANDSIYGLAAAVWSTDVDRPLRLARRIDAGTVWINNWAVIYDESAEGGYKQSGLGRLNGVAAMEDFVEYKTVIQELSVVERA